jgi:hypothetical protein
MQTIQEKLDRGIKLLNEADHGVATWFRKMVFEQ